MNLVNCEKCDVQICGRCPSGPGGWHKVEEGNGFMQILRTPPHCSALYCTVLYCTVLYCTLLYFTVLCCSVRHSTEQYCNVLYCTVLQRGVLYWSPCAECEPSFVPSVPSLTRFYANLSRSSNLSGRCVTAPHSHTLHCTPLQYVLDQLWHCTVLG